MQEAALKAHGIIWGIAGATICTKASVEPVNSIWGNMISKIVSFDTHLLSVDSRSMIKFSAVAIFRVMWCCSFQAVKVFKILLAGLLCAFSAERERYRVETSAIAISW